MHCGRQLLGLVYTLLLAAAHGTWPALAAPDRALRRLHELNPDISPALVCSVKLVTAMKECVDARSAEPGSACCTGLREWQAQCGDKDNVLDAETMSVFNEVIQKCTTSTGGSRSPSPTPPSATINTSAQVVQAGKWPLTTAQQECVQLSSASSIAYHRYELLSLVLGFSFLLDGGGTAGPETKAALALPAVRALANLTNLSIGDVAKGFAAWVRQVIVECDLPDLRTEGSDQYGATLAWWASLLRADALPTTLYGLTPDDLAAVGNPSTQLSTRSLLWTLTDTGLSQEAAGWVAAAAGAGSSFLVGMLAGHLGGLVAASVISAACFAAAPLAGVAVGIVAAAGTAYAVGTLLDGGCKELYDSLEEDQRLVDRFEAGQPIGTLLGGLLGLSGIVTKTSKAATALNKVVGKNEQILEQVDELARLKDAGATREAAALERSIRSARAESVMHERDAAITIADVVCNEIGLGDVVSEAGAPAALLELQRLAAATPSVPIEGPGTQLPTCQHEADFLHYEHGTPDEMVSACQALWSPGAVPSLSEGQDPGVGGELTCRADSYETAPGRWASPRPAACDVVEAAAGVLGVLSIPAGCAIYFWCTDPTPNDYGEIDIQWIVSVKQAFEF